MVSSYCQLLKKRYSEKLDDDAQEFIGYATDGAMRMKRLIEDLLKISRVSTTGVEFKEVDLTDLVPQAVQNLKIALEESEGSVEIGEMPTVSADPGQIVQLLQNLIGNAIKYRGDVPPRVRVWSERLDRAWRISVADNGIGIDEKYKERVFQMFQRLHTREQYSGTGIGLAVCRKIVHRHGGEIWVESKAGEGSTFHFTIPDREEEEEL